MQTKKVAIKKVKKKKINLRGKMPIISVFNERLNRKFDTSGLCHMCKCH